MQVRLFDEIFFLDLLFAIKLDFCIGNVLLRIICLYIILCNCLHIIIIIINLIKMSCFIEKLSIYIYIIYIMLLINNDKYFWI